MKDLCVVDWAAVAAWVQAIGSIGAIAAAIWIGNRQHKQNIELVEKERERVEARDAKSEQAVRDLAHKAIAMLDDPLDAMRDAHRKVLDLVEAGKGQMIIGDAAELLQQKFLALHAMSKVVLAQFVELKPIYYAAGATHAVFQFHTASSLEVISLQADICAKQLRNSNYEEDELKVEELVRTIEDFHADIIKTLRQL